MAGMLPGVESARRRRFHRTNCDQPSPISTPGTSTRRSSNYMQRNPIRHETILLCDESRLGTAAREAKKRLDERLQPPWRSHINRNLSIIVAFGQQFGALQSPILDVKDEVWSRIEKKSDEPGEKRKNMAKCQLLQVSTGRACSIAPPVLNSDMKTQCSTYSTGWSCHTSTARAPC